MNGNMKMDKVTAFMYRVKRFLIYRVFQSALDYHAWITQNEPTRYQLAKQRGVADSFRYKPLISIILPVWNAPKKILDQTIASVLQQTYPHWELCIADGNSSVETQQTLSKWVKKSDHIHVRFLKENKGISVNSNEALTLAQGEFVCFLDHDDCLAPFALFEVVQRLQAHSNADVLFSDEDKIDQNGGRFDPFFKPEFSPDYLRSVNYMPHLLVVRRSLGEEIKWFREGYDGAQDYDLILRLVEKTHTILHIPKILYHWRVWASSTASGSDAKPYANNAGKKALRDHIQRIGLPAEVKDGHSSTFYRLQYQIPNSPRISIVIPNHDHAADLKTCIDSIFHKSSYPNYEILLVENGSKAPETFHLYEDLQRDPRVRIVNWHESFNYSRVNNWAVTQARGEVILFLNNDVEVINENWLEEMLQFAIRPDIGAVGAKLYYPDGTLQHGGIIVGLGGVAGHSHKNFPRQHPGYFRRLVSIQNLSAVTAACLMVRKQVFEEVNGFDENYVLAFGDVDLCLSILKKGYLNVWTPYAELYHHESKTRGQEDTPEKVERFGNEIQYFKNRWTKFLMQGDPYYSPNLTLDYENFGLNIRPTKFSKFLQPRLYVQKGYALARGIYRKLRVFLPG
jgi:GT2 family glycosyltransferase